ncbi:MAG: penicillin-binding transpeptidase domain-containing protein [Patescibacteria group bacterium]
MISFYKKKEYRISVSHDDWVTPEETLMDSSSDYSNIEQPISMNVFRITTGIIVVLFAVISFGTFKISILGNAFYADLATQNKTVNFTISPPRGLIFDNEGQALVKNVPSFDLVAISRDLPRDAAQLKENVDVLAKILSKNPEETNALITDGAKNNSLFIVASDIPKEIVLAFSQLNLKGFYVVATTKRSYIDGHQFSTVVGYIGKVSRDNLEKDSYYLVSDSIGRAGIEAAYEEALRGTHGRIFFTQQEGSSTQQEPAPGDDVVLNLNHDIQETLYNTLFNTLRTANLGRAAAIVQDPRSGAVLGMVSFPGYDNNIFNSAVSQEEFEKLFLSPSKPLFNRAVSGLYNPGSVIKPFIGMAGLEEGVITRNTTIQDCVNITIPNPLKPDEPTIYKNWRVDLGPFNLRRAIADSCNVFFYTLGGGHNDIPGLGISRIAKYLKGAWADAILGIDLPGEEKGFVPTPEWKRKNTNENWYLGDTYNISIGQGDLVVSPLWINSYISAIANGGTMYKPSVVNRIVDNSKNPIRVFQPDALGRLPFKDEVIREVKRDMQETVLSGTAKLLSGLPVTAGAKTGTAEVVKNTSINSLFTAFAPFENPEVAITILIEGAASNEGHATRTAYDFLKWYFDPNRKTQ